MAAALSTAELKRELQRMVPADQLAACIERPDFEKLYEEAKAAAPPAQARPRPQEAPKPPPSKPRTAEAEDTGLPFGMSWPNVIFFGLLAYLVAGGLGLTGGGGSKEPEVLASAGESAVLMGQVVELKTHPDFESTLNLHRDQTALPVVVDFYSNGCGERSPVRAAQPRWATDAPLVRAAQPRWPPTRHSCLRQVPAV